MGNPTLLEKLLGARIHLRLFGFWCGTGHLQYQRNEDTDEDDSSSDEEDE
tara:strand:+ start:155 stop:304 length:150 start_codon:yes stop_codon:yes gene_type:complete